MAKHTPGPWDVECPMGAEIGLSIVQRGLKTYQWEFIAMVMQSDESNERNGSQRFISPEEQDANARLIAAAPELLEALKEAATTLEGCRYSEQPMARKLRKLIAEVEDK